ncbi:hypothetical protein YTPLAS18_23100 [Nitrospira sp.]|nr:hypothetical protein YTPLAS18_23100 [Nitrospira sp.]
MLDGLLDHSGTEASSAHADVLPRAVHDGVHALEIRVEDSLGLVIRVADIMTRPMSFATEIAPISHDRTPC